MRRLKIHGDEHGPYVIGNGSIFRPVLPDRKFAHSYTGTKYRAADGWTVHCEGDVVKGGLILNSPHCVVGGEVWYNHGASPALLNAMHATKGMRRPAAWNPRQDTPIISADDNSENNRGRLRPQDLI